MVCALNDLDNNTHLIEVIGIFCMVKCVSCTCIFPVRKYLNAIFSYYHSVGKENYTQRCHLKGCRQKRWYNYLDNINSFCEEYSLIDLWPIAMSYLIKSVTIYPGNSSDHSLIKFTLDLINTPKRGKGFWKFNNSLISDLDYISMIKGEITNIKNNFCTKNKNSLLKFAKCKIRTETMLFSRIKSKLMKNYDA